MAIEEWIGTNGECANLPLDKGRESGVEVAFGAGLHDHQFLPERDGPRPALLPRQPRQSEKLGFISMPIVRPLVQVSSPAQVVSRPTG